MIGFFQTFEDLQNWARGRARTLEEDYTRTGNLVSLGYALAMQDIVRSEMGLDVEVPAYQRAIEVLPAEILDISSLKTREAA